MDHECTVKCFQSKKEKGQEKKGKERKFVAHIALHIAVHIQGYRRAGAGG